MLVMNGAQALARQLRAEGVDTVFALPGVQVMAAFDALYEVRDDIRLVHTRHEQATTYMADGYAKVTGKPGVAMVVPGPGALNAAAGLGTAYASSGAGPRFRTISASESGSRPMNLRNNSSGSELSPWARMDSTKEAPVSGLKIPSSMNLPNASASNTSDHR